MARHFVAASSQYLERAGVIVAAVPLTISIWVKTSTPAQAAFCGTLCKAASNAWWTDGMNLADANMKGYQYDGTTAAPAAATLALPANAWTHVCGVFTSNSSRACFINGANKGTNSTTTGTPAVDRVIVAGVYLSGAPGFFFDGDLAEFAIWNVALPDADVATLAAGAPATRVGAGTLAAYYPLLGISSPEPDVMGGTGLTLVNGPTAATHPPIVGGGAGRMFQVF